jgi:ribose-phosphate pyrophosphokinase
MELLIMVDALKRASAERISAVIPYFGYARQDRRPRSTRVPITAKVVANMLQTVGVARVLTMDLHADQIQGFFDIPVDNIYASPVLLGDLRQKKYEDLIVVSPDVGGVVRARALAKQLGLRPGHHRQTPSQGQRQRGHARDRRNRRPQLRHHGRHD